MAKVFIEETTLTAIGDAIRSKTGGSDPINVTDMATTISGITTGSGGGECTGRHIPDEVLNISGSCNYMFANGHWDWLVEMYGNDITTENLSSTSYMFNNTNLSSFPFEINYRNGGGDCSCMFLGSKLETIQSIDFKHTDSYANCNNMFKSCSKLEEIGKLKNLYPNSMDSMFEGCTRLRYLPEFENLNLDRVYSYNASSIRNMFYQCSSLRSIPENFLKQLKKPSATSYLYPVFYNGFYGCYVLDEIRGLNPETSTVTQNLFNSSFNYCYRVKDIIFATKEDGTPYDVNWKAQVIDLTQNVGYCNAGYAERITGYNSGITSDKYVTDDASYQALKNDPDWYSTMMAYSRYNHDSAVNTINSLPNITATGTNTIKFNGGCGYSTDGGAINTLTEEEIAVATAKGWTVTLV